MLMQNTFRAPNSVVNNVNLVGIYILWHGWCSSVESFVFVVQMNK